MREEEKGEEEEDERNGGVENNVSGELGPLWPVTYREERENALFVWPKIIVVKMWVPRYSPIAQCFKHKGTFILKYIIIQHHFHKLGKMEAFKLFVLQSMEDLRKEVKGKRKKKMREMGELKIT